MQIIGVGVGRTGTYSLKMAIDQLGFGPCHHMEAVLQNLGRYVIMTAGDNRTMLISSGFDVRKDPESTTLDTPHLVSLATGKNPGEVMVKVNGTDARSFVYECTADPITDASIWTQEVSTRKNHVLAGLKPSGKIWGINPTKFP